MKIALIAPPFIPVPPKQYGGTELFIAELAVGLQENGIDVVVYANGESTVPVEVRAFYAKSQWPIQDEHSDTLKDSNHSALAVAEASETCDIIHINNATGLTYSRFVPQPFVYTVHHPAEKQLTDFYSFFPNVNFVCISKFQAEAQQLRSANVIHHGLDFSNYSFEKKKQKYLSFIGRIAPVKGTHLAIEVAQKSGIPLKIAGQVQPAYKDYFESQIKPHIDGKFIEYIGEADMAAKNELLSDSMAMLFPIQWDEPFGLVLVEAMACGTPVLALPGGSVAEIVQDGVSGYICDSVEEMVERAKKLETRPMSAAGVRKFVENNFSSERMVSAYIDLYTNLLSYPEKIVEDLSELPQASNPKGAVA